MRLFVALELTEDWRDAASAVRAHLEHALDAEARNALRWVQPDLLHLTLRFLGEFADDHLTELQAELDVELDAELSDLLPLDLSSSTLGSFGGPSRLQVIWLGVAGDLSRLDALARHIERACVAAGAAPEARPLAPHITLARIRDRVPTDARRAIGAALADVPPPAVTLRSTTVALVRSHLGSGPPRYEVLSRHPRATALLEERAPSDADGERPSAP